MSTIEDASECGKFLWLIGTRLRGLTERQREPVRALGAIPAPRLRPM